MSMNDQEDLVILDGPSFVTTWPLALAESLLEDETPWWSAWSEHAGDHPDQGADFAMLANCVYSSCRDATTTDITLIGRQAFSEWCMCSNTQELLDAISFISRQEVFRYGMIRTYEQPMRLALREVVLRARSEHPPRFLAVTRLKHALFSGNTRVGVLMPYERQSFWTHCHFVADPAFSAFRPLFEEAYQRSKAWKENNHVRGWENAYAKIAALHLFLVREDGKQGYLRAIRIHGEKGAFCPRHRVLC